MWLIMKLSQNQLIQTNFIAILYVLHGIIYFLTLMIVQRSAHDMMEQ